MPNGKCKNAAKEKVLNNLERNLPEQPEEAESFAVGENCIQSLI